MRWDFVFAGMRPEPAGPRWIRRLTSLIALALLMPGCTREPTERERVGVLTWLTCVECGPAELDFVVDSLGPTVIPLLEDGLIGLDTAYRANLTYQFEAAYDRLPSASFTRDAYVERFLTNFDAMVQRRAAVALGELGATGILSSALSDSSQHGYRPDVILSIRQALAKAGAGLAAPSLAVTVEIVPGDVAIRQASSASLRAVVRDANGTEVPTPVTWASTNTAIATVSSQPQQMAQVTGLAVGTSMIRATAASGGQATVTVTVLEAAPANLVIEYVSGSLQSGSVNSVLPKLLVVRVTDLSGTELEGEQVDWRFPDNRGTFTATNTATHQTVTDATGTTAVEVRLGAAAGLVAVEATIGGNPVRFRLRAN